MIGPKIYFVGLKQSGLELPSNFCFTLLNEKLFPQMKEKTLEEVQKYEKLKKEKQRKKRKRKRENKS